jgi:hypothetical protein
MDLIEDRSQVARHRVAMAGWVVDGQTGKPIPGARVTIESMPAPFERMLQFKALQYGKQWETTTDRPDRTTTTRDGRFYFLDLPEGKYVLRASLAAAGNRYGGAEVRAAVSRKDAETIKIPTVNIPLQPTNVKGRITTSSQKTGVFMAEARVKGSGERTYSDAKGEYVLCGIEPGKRTIQVFAQGYKPAEEGANLKKPGDSCTLDFVLARATP